jgi:hypothetical protein
LPKAEAKSLMLMLMVGVLILLFSLRTLYLSLN